MDLQLLKGYWLDIPPERRKRILAYALAAWVILLVFIFYSLQDRMEQTRQQITQTEQRLDKVLSLAEKVDANAAQSADLANMDPMPAVQEVTRDMQIGSKLASVQPVEQGQAGSSGVQVIYQQLNLPELVNLLHNLRTRGGLNIITCNLSKRMDDSKLADLQMLLSK
jgi:type II secretory pathway component PulM